MHELSIAQNIIDIVHSHVPAHERGGVKVVRMRIGAMAGVVVDSLEFCFQAVVAGTPLQGAQLDVHYVPLRLHCSKCNATTEIDMPQFFCDSCGASTVTIVSGTELQVMEIEMRDEGERQ